METSPFFMSFLSRLSVTPTPSLTKFLAFLMSGPALGPKGVNIGQVIAKINEKTKAYEGMKVPVKILINDDKTFDVKVGTPPISALIKGELGVESGAHNAKAEKVGNLSIDQIYK